MGDLVAERGSKKVKSPSSWLKIFETPGFSFVKTSKSLKSDIANSIEEEKELAEKNYSNYREAFNIRIARNKKLGEKRAAENRKEILIAQDAWRCVTSTTYETAQARQKRKFDSWFYG